jgi:hypothetical protein
MLRKLFMVVAILALWLPSQAQNMRKALKKRTAEAGVYGNFGYYGNPHWGTGANIHYMHGIGRKRQTISIGAGVRGNLFFSKDRDYTTSSAVLSAANPGGADSMFMKDIQTNTVNAYLAVKIFVKKGVNIIFTTDIGGVNFGDRKEGYFHSYETDPVPPGTRYYTEPYAFNCQIPGGESYGTIMTELYGTFRINEVLMWRLGVNHLRNEYVTDRNIPMNGKRFSQSNWMVMTGIGFDIRWQKNMRQGSLY